MFGPTSSHMAELGDSRCWKIISNRLLKSAFRVVAARVEALARQARVETAEAWAAEVRAKDGWVDSNSKIKVKFYLITKLWMWLDNNG